MPTAWMNRPSARARDARGSSTANTSAAMNSENGRPEQVAAADEEERRVVDRDDLPAGDQLRDAAPGHHQDQRRDDRLHADARHQQAVPQPAQQRPTPSAATIASHIGKRLTCRRRRHDQQPPIIQAASAAAIATTAPTEMSMPRVAITSVMPSDTSTSGAARLRMSIRLPYRWPSRHSRCRKLGLKAALTASSSSSVTTGQARRWRERALQGCWHRGAHVSAAISS